MVYTNQKIMTLSSARGRLDVADTKDVSIYNWSKTRNQKQWPNESMHYIYHKDITNIDSSKTERDKTEKSERMQCLKLRKRVNAKLI